MAYPHLVNDEQSDQAEALLRGLLARGVAPDKVRHALLSAITDHFLGYGHPMIFAHKSFELLDKIGWEEADTVLSPLVPNMVLSTRYDRLPYMRKFLKAWEAADVDLDAIVAKQNSGPFDAEGFRRAVLDGDPQTSFAALNGALEAGVDVGKILNVTSGAAAERFRRFDIDIDTDDTNEWGWLDVTHNMTYLDALRWAWSVDPSPEVLRGLYHAVWFVNFTRRFDERNPRVRQEPAVTSDADSIVTAIRNKDPEGAEALIAGYEGPAEELRGAIARGASEDNSIAPIMVAHAVKTARASIIESEAIGDRSPMIAAGRFMASPKRERFVYNATLEAIAFTAGRSRGEGE